MTKRFHQRLRSERLEDRQLLHGGGLGEPPTPAERAAAIVERFDGDDSGDISMDEVSERVWAKLVRSDADENLVVTAEELTAKFEARLEARAEREQARIQRRVDRIFAATDGAEGGNGDDMIQAGETTEDRWAKLAEADEDGDDAVSREELANHIAEVREARREERERRAKRRRGPRRPVDGPAQQAPETPQTPAPQDGGAQLQ